MILSERVLKLLIGNQASTDGQTDRHTDRQTDRQTDRPTDRHLQSNIPPFFQKGGIKMQVHKHSCIFLNAGCCWYQFFCCFPSYWRSEDHHMSMSTARPSLHHSPCSLGHRSHYADTGFDTHSSPPVRDHQFICRTSWFFNHQNLTRATDVQENGVKLPNFPLN